MKRFCICFAYYSDGCCLVRVTNKNQSANDRTLNQCCGPITARRNARDRDGATRTSGDQSENKRRSSVTQNRQGDHL